MSKPIVLCILVLTLPIIIMSFSTEERLDDININFIKVMKVTQRSEIIVENDQVAPLFSSFNFFFFFNSLKVFEDVYQGIFMKKLRPKSC